MNVKELTNAVLVSQRNFFEVYNDIQEVDLIFSTMPEDMDGKARKILGGCLDKTFENANKTFETRFVLEDFQKIIANAIIHSCTDDVPLEEDAYENAVKGLRFYLSQDLQDRVVDLTSAAGIYGLKIHRVPPPVKALQATIDLLNATEELKSEGLLFSTKFWKDIGDELINEHAPSDIKCLSTYLGLGSNGHQPIFYNGNDMV